MTARRAALASSTSEGSTMTFKKDGSDPVTARPNVISMGGLQWVVNAAMNALGFGLAATNQPEDQFRYRRSRGQPARHKHRRNMNLVSKRVRAKHRRARKAA